MECRYELQVEGVQTLEAAQFARSLDINNLVRRLARMYKSVTAACSSLPLPLLWHTQSHSTMSHEASAGGVL